MDALLLGSSSDPHAVHMRDHLRKQAADVELLDSRQFPGEISLALDPVSRRGSLGLPTGRSLKLDQIRSVYWRSYDGIGTPALPDPSQSYIATNDARSLFESLLIDLPARWVNGWKAFQLHQTKPVQLARIAAAGIPVPATLLSNDAESVREFSARYPRAIFKPIQGGAHTRPLTAAHLTPENLQNLSHAPVTIQEHIRGTNIRVFVAGEQTHACEIRTEALDFREDERPEITPHELPPEIADDCRRIAHLLYLLWTGIDFRRTPEGHYVFLEANPSPMFLGFETQTGIPLTDSLAALLLAGPTVAPSHG